MKKKVSWGEAWIILRPGTIEDEIAAQVIHADVMNAYGPTDKGLWRQFGQICSVSESSEGTFKPELMIDANSATRQRAYVEFIRLPSKVLDKLMAAFNAVNAGNDVTVEDIPDESDPKKA